MANEQVIFRRVHGRLVPIRVKRTTPDYTNPAAVAGGVKAGVAGGTGVFGAIKGFQYSMFKRSERLLEISKRYASRPEPKMWVDMVRVGKKAKLLEPDMFQQAAFRKAGSVFAHNQVRAAHYAARGELFRRASSFVTSHAGKFAIGAGVAIGAAAYLRSVAIDRTKSRKRVH